MPARSAPPRSRATATSSDLLRFPRPTVAVDIAVLTVATHPWSGRWNTAEGLGVLLLRRADDTRPGPWALPGSMIRERERLAPAVLRTLHDKCGIEGLAPRQLGAFDEPDRDERGWVLSLAHSDAVPFRRLAPALERNADLTVAPVHGAGEATRADVPGRQRRLPFDHDDIVRLAVDDLRSSYHEAPDPAGLIGDTFTLLELRRLHEAVHGQPLQKDTFRRQMAPHLDEVDEWSDGTVGRPARLFRVRG